MQQQATVIPDCMADVLHEKGMTDEEFAAIIPTLDHLIEALSILGILPSAWLEQAGLGLQRRLSHQETHPEVDRRREGSHGLGGSVPELHREARLRKLPHCYDVNFKLTIEKKSSFSCLEVLLFLYYITKVRHFPAKTATVSKEITIFAIKN